MGPGWVIDAAKWAEREFGAAQLGDARRTRRLVQIAARLLRRPGGMLPEQLRTRRALKAADRFFGTRALHHARLQAPPWVGARTEV
jgi:hypothetical protein